MRLSTSLARALLPVALAGIASGCELFGPRYFVEEGMIISYSDTSRIVVPDTVLAGAPFDVLFDTYTTSCGRGPTRTEVTLNDLVAEVHPYNEMRPFQSCPDFAPAKNVIRHATTIRFARGGEAIVRVVGRLVPTSGPYPYAGGPATIERRVTVR